MATRRKPNRRQRKWPLCLWQHIQVFLWVYLLYHPSITKTPQTEDDVENMRNIFPTGLSIVPQTVDDVNNMRNIFPLRLSIVPPLSHKKTPPTVDDTHMCNILHMGLLLMPTTLSPKNTSDCGQRVTFFLWVYYLCPPNHLKNHLRL